jgi:hypothetical protein
MAHDDLQSAYRRGNGERMRPEHPEALGFSIIISYTRPARRPSLKYQYAGQKSFKERFMQNTAWLTLLKKNMH